MGTSKRSKKWERKLARRIAKAQERMPVTARKATAEDWRRLTELQNAKAERQGRTL